MKYTDKNGHEIKSGSIVYFKPIKCNCLIATNMDDELIIKGQAYPLKMTQERADQMEIKTDVDK